MGISEMFSDGDAYEVFMGRWSRQVAALLVRFAEVGDGDAVLDVGSGTGALGESIALALPRCRVIGIEPVEAYVALAQGRRPHDRVSYEIGEAGRLPFDDGRFDRTLSLFAMNFMPDPAKALAEMIRVTRPIGTVAAAVWDYDSGMEMLRIFWDEAVALNPAIADSDERRMPLCRPGELASLWRAHALDDVCAEPLTIEMRFPSFDAYWSPFLYRQGPAGAYVASLSASERETLRRRLHDRLVSTDGDGEVVLRARAWAARGAVPARI